MSEPSFAKSELREGKVLAMTNRGDVYMLQLDWDDRPTIHLVKHGDGRVPDEWPPLPFT